MSSISASSRSPPPPFLGGGPPPPGPGGGGAPPPPPPPPAGGPPPPPGRVGGRLHAERRGVRVGLAGHQRVDQVGLGILLEGILGIAGVVQVGIGSQFVAQQRRTSLRFRQLFL